MKFYETHYEDYIHGVNEWNIHPELKPSIDKIHNNGGHFENLIVYGPQGVGKYSQVLYLLQPYSPSFLNYDKKIKIQIDKHEFIYKISDIHYEIDMSLLGCNSKILWHDIFLQIVDIISVKSNKMGILLCKNFHNIHTELLEIFYSYIQQYNYPQSTLQLKFIILTEHISFIPNNILNCCKILSIGRPTKENYKKISGMNYSVQKDSGSGNKVETLNYTTFLKCISYNKTNQASASVSCMENNELIHEIIDNIDSNSITNIKELKTFSLMDKTNMEIPSDIFNVICNNLIREMENSNKIVFTQFRDAIYDILIYNLEFTDCLWYILSHFIKKGDLSAKSSHEIIQKTHEFLKYYNNNYRPIYHLESILFFIVMRLHK
jgi:hypothetical protein